ncbi:MAG: deoxyribodipyrimidine photo-lyase [Spirulinaceae cyanobacterium SM2_1_0]|nr:deoxyribodipyrimidine photo-lyase [Spirulinaceae cyanobacterium SM2_1_0]
MQNPLVWVHGDHLSPRNPALVNYPQAPALWVWDEQLLADWQISFKRLVFIYECLLELPVTIRRGDVAAELLAFARAQQADGIVTAASPSPRFQAICAQLEAELPLAIIVDEPFVPYDGDLEIKRFSRYWRQAKQHVVPTE